MTVAEPLVASTLGVAVLGETLDADGPEVIALVAAVIVVIVATTGLARGEAASMNVQGAGPDGASRDGQSPVPSSAAGEA